MTGEAEAAGSVSGVSGNESVCSSIGGAEAASSDGEGTGRGVEEAEEKREMAAAQAAAAVSSWATGKKSCHH